MLTIHTETIFHLLNKLKQINTKDLSDIEIYEKGEKIEIDPKIIKDFELTGLSNVDFISSRYYLGKN